MSKLVDDYGNGETCITTFEYDSDGMLCKVVETYKGGEDDGHMVTKKFLIVGTKLIATWDTNDENWDTTYTYTKYENKTKQNKTNNDFNWQLIQVWEYDFVETSYFGVKSKNLIASVTEGGERYTYEYTFDKDGYVTTIKAYDESGVKTLDYTTTVTYKE